MGSQPTSGSVISNWNVLLGAPQRETKGCRAVAVQCQHIKDSPGWGGVYLLNAQVQGPILRDCDSAALGKCTLTALPTLQVL